MNVDKTLFAQVMEYVPWKTFGRIIDHHDEASMGDPWRGSKLSEAM